MLLTPERCDVVIVRYVNDITHLIQRLSDTGFHVKVYEKHPNQREKATYFVPQNKGNEASGFLQYIIEHYTALPEHVIFLHDHESSWHHTGNIYDRIMEHIQTEVSYVNLNNISWNADPVEWISSLLDWYDTYFYSEMGSVHKYGDFMIGHKSCAQFIVHKSVILQRSLSFYQRIYDWLFSTELEDFYSGRYLEYTWHLMWNQVPTYNYLVQKFAYKLLSRIGRKPSYLYRCIQKHEEKS